jgi:acetyl-CoA C-acetyltransferase
MSSDERRPVLVGVAQWTPRPDEREADPRETPEPLAALEDVARGAARDAGAGERALRSLDAIALVSPMGWHPKNGPRLLAGRLDARPRAELLGAIGGESPILLLNHLAERIAAGELRSALLAGTHHVRTLRRARKRGAELRWESGGDGEATLVGKNRDGTTQAEQRYGLLMPADVYPLFENALRAKRGLSLAEHRRRMGALMAPFTEVAAGNPYAWFPVKRSAEELVAVGPNNRMVAFPYTKYLNAVMETDQAAALVLASAAEAHAWGVPEEKLVHWWGGAVAAEEAWYASERPDHGACPALRVAARGALAQAGVALDEIDAFDFYSCFPVAVSMACEMLGLREDDPRGLTVVGGLPYAGGPGNGYTLHALAGMVERLRAQPRARGLVTGNGWYLTKHSAVVLASAPKPAGAGRGAVSPEPAAHPTAPVPVHDDVEGAARIATYTVVYDREGAPARGIVVGEHEDGRRFLANTPPERPLLEDLVATEGVGRRGRVERRDDRLCFLPG